MAKRTWTPNSPWGPHQHPGRACRRWPSGPLSVGARAHARATALCQHAHWPRWQVGLLALVAPAALRRPVHSLVACPAHPAQPAHLTLRTLVGHGHGLVLLLGRRGSRHALRRLDLFEASSHPNRCGLLSCGRKGTPRACWAAARPAQALRCSDGNPTHAELPTAGADQCQPVWAAVSAFRGRDCPAASARVAGAASRAVRARDCPAASLPRLGLPRWHFSAWTADHGSPKLRTGNFPPQAMQPHECHCTDHYR